MDAVTPLLPRASTGIAGLDDILGGGLARNRLHLLEGSPGTGKTTIALQFLMAGGEIGEAGIYISLAETEKELRDGARSHGWTIGPKHRDFRAGAAGERARPRSASEPAVFLRPRARRDRAADLRLHRADQAAAHRDRQPVGNPSVGAKLVALPAANSGAEALFRPA